MISHVNIAKNCKSPNIIHQSSPFNSISSKSHQTSFPSSEADYIKSCIHKIIPFNTIIIPQHNTEQHISQHYRPAHHSTSHYRIIQKIAQNVSTRTLQHGTIHITLHHSTNQQKTAYYFTAQNCKPSTAHVSVTKTAT